VQISWFTFFAQIVNFLILLVLLRLFLYGPILQVMNKREEEIAARFREADELADQAQSEAEALREQREVLDRNRDELIREATEMAERRRVELLENARAEVDEVQKSWYSAIEDEKERFLQDLRARMGETVCRVAHDALADLANSELEEAIAEEFLDKLRERPIDGAGDEAVTETDTVAVVRSAFDLPPKVREDIRQVLTDSIGSDNHDRNDPEQVAVAFSVSPELICGVEAQFGDRRVAWNIRDYLDSYAEQLDSTIMSTVTARQEPERTVLEKDAAGGILPG
jgi:F-type H+-transporting ATPase subunit b